MAGKQLSGRTIAFLATDGFEQVEFTTPWEAIRDAGAKVELISPKSGTVQGMNHDKKADTFTVDKTIDSVSAEDYDGLVLPGGVANPDALRMNDTCVDFVRDFSNRANPLLLFATAPGC